MIYLFVILLALGVAFLTVVLMKMSDRPRPPADAPKRKPIVKSKQ